MPATRLIRLPLFFVFAFLASVSARAEISLLTVRWEQPEPLPLPAFHGFSIGYPMFGYHGHSESHPNFVTEYPALQSADSVTLSEWNQRNAIGTAIAGFGAFSSAWGIGGPQDPRYQSAWRIPDDRTDWADGRMFDDIGNPSVGSWTVTPHAPQLGRGLAGYMLTNVERVIDSTGQTVRFYGIVSPIPEPSPLILVVLACVHLSMRRCR